MSTVSKFASYHTVITTGYTNPTNGYSDDGVYATAAPGKNADVSAYWGFAAFGTGDIPDGSSINSVAVEVQFKVSVNTSVAEQYIQVFKTTTAQGTEQANTAEPTSDTILSHSITSGITLADLRSADTVRARTRSRRGNSNTAVTFSVDYVKITVDYTVPISLTANDIISGNTVVETTSLNQSFPLTANNIISQNTNVGATTLSINISISANGVTSGIPVIESPVLSMAGAELSANDIITQSPTVDTPTASIGNISISSLDIYSNSPILETPSITILSSLIANNVFAQNSIVESPILSSQISISANDIFAQPSIIETPSLVNTISVSANDIYGGTPFIENTTLSTNIPLVPNDIFTQASIVEQPTPSSGDASLLSNNIIASNPVVESPSLTPEISLNALGILGGSSSIDFTNLSVAINIVANDIISTNPFIASPTFTLGTIAITANDIISGAPFIAQPNFANEGDMLVEDIISTNPIVGTPAVRCYTTLKIDGRLLVNPEYTILKINGTLDPILKISTYDNTQI